MRLRIAAFGMVLFSVFLLGWMASDIPFSLPYSNVDFYTYYAGGKLFSQQQNIYSSELTNALLTAQELPYIQNSDYIYPPYMALLLSFVAGIPPRVLAFVWGILNLAGLALSVYWLADLVSDSQSRVRKFTEFLLLALCFMPTQYALFVGQVNMILLALMIGAFRWDIRNQGRLAGIVLGIAILIKVSPAILLWYFLCRARWTTLVWSGIVVLAVGLVTFPWTYDYNLLYLTEVMPHLSQPQAHAVNQSLNGFFSRILTDNVFSTAWVNAPTLSRLLTLAASGVMGVFSLLVVFRGVRPVQSSLRQHLYAYLLLITISVIVSPLAWENLYVLLVIPLLALFSDWRDLTLWQRRFVLLSAALMTVQRVWAPYGETPGAFLWAHDLTLLMSLGLYGAFFLIIVLRGKILTSSTSAL